MPFNMPHSTDGVYIMLPFTKNRFDLLPSAKNPDSLRNNASCFPFFSAILRANMFSK